MLSNNKEENYCKERKLPIDNVYYAYYFKQDLTEEKIKNFATYFINKYQLKRLAEPNYNSIERLKDYFPFKYMFLPAQKKLFENLQAGLIYYEMPEECFKEWQARVFYVDFELEHCE